MQNRAGEIEEQGDAENHDATVIMRPVVHPSGGSLIAPVKTRRLTARLSVAPEVQDKVSLLPTVYVEI